jgi:hypothetical protein
MHNLEEFYYTVVCRTLPSDRYFAIQEIQDVVVINFDCVYDRACVLRGNDQLIYLAHKLGQDKRFLFISEDGANIQLSGALAVIKNIIKCFKLTTETCAVICREDITISDCTVINNPSVPYWCNVIYQTIKNIKIPTGPFSKKFAIWVNRGTFYRLDLVKHLHTYHKEQSYISYQEKGMITDPNLKEYFDTWADTNTPIVYDRLWPDRMYTHDMIVGASRKPYNDYFLEVVAETDILTTTWITEKTVKNLYIGIPFIVMGGPGTLQKIKSFGFRTFSPWINESYDQIENIHLRLESIKQEINRLAGNTIEELIQMKHDMMPILQHNRQIYDEYITSRR